MHIGETPHNRPWASLTPQYNWPRELWTISLWNNFLAQLQKSVQCSSRLTIVSRSWQITRWHLIDNYLWLSWYVIPRSMHTTTRGLEWDCDTQHNDAWCNRYLRLVHYVLNLIAVFVLYACFFTNIVVILFYKGVFALLWLSWLFLRLRLGPKRVRNEELYCN